MEIHFSGNCDVAPARNFMDPLNSPACLVRFDHVASRIVNNPNVPDSKFKTTVFRINCGIGGENDRKRKIGNWKVASLAKSIQCFNVSNESRPRENFLVTLLQFDKTARHEMCSSDHIRFYCVRFAGMGSVTTAFSGESRPAI
jgi:hypothetical protein